MTMKNKWICILKSTFPQYQPDIYKCSKCGYESTYEYPHCPGCGKKMQKGDKE